MGLDCERQAQLDWAGFVISGVHLDNRSHHGAWGPRHRGDTTRDTGQPPSCPTSRCDVVLYQPCHVALATHRGLTSLPLHASVYAGDEAAPSPSRSLLLVSIGRSAEKKVWKEFWFFGLVIVVGASVSTLYA